MTGPVPAGLVTIREKKGLFTLLTHPFEALQLDATATRRSA